MDGAGAVHRRPLVHGSSRPRGREPPGAASAIAPAPVYRQARRASRTSLERLHRSRAARRYPSWLQGLQGVRESSRPKIGAALNASEQRRQTRPQWWEATEAETRMLHDLSPAQITDMQQSLGALPLIVLTAPAHKIPGISRQQQITIENLWKTMHGELAALSSEGLDRPVPCSTHFIQLDCPSVVIGAIGEIISRGRSIRSPKLAPPAAPKARRPQLRLGTSSS